jgi:hypothetical protein
MVSEQVFPDDHCPYQVNWQWLIPRTPCRTWIIVLVFFIVKKHFTANLGKEPHGEWILNVSAWVPDHFIILDITWSYHLHGNQQLLQGVGESILAIECWQLIKYVHHFCRSFFWV